MHLDDEQVQRLLHRELAPPMETLAREHLGGCADCRGRVAEAQREEDEVHALFRHLDHPVPQVDAQAVAARARARDFGWLRWAAGIVLALGLAGAAYAMPGSPLPAWMEALVEWIGGGSDRTPSAPAPAQSPNPEVAGIAVAPGRELVILFTSLQREGQVQVSLTEGAEVVLRAPSGAATFTSDVDRLVIHNQGSTATFEIEIPRAAPRVEIRVNAVRIFLKEGPRVTTDRSAETGGFYVLPLTPSGS